MPLYRYRCKKCKKELDLIQLIDAESPSCCNGKMEKVIMPPAMIKIKGLGYPSRRKWAENWTPNSPTFKTGSQHGEKY